MLANVYTKALRDRWLGWMLAIVGLTAIAYFGMFVYSDLDDFVEGMRDSLPEAMRNILGLTETTTPATFLLSAVFTSYGPFIVMGLAISMGSAAVAGEERDGTFDILQSNPVERTTTVLSKAGAILTLVTAGSLVSGGGMWIASRAVGADLTGVDLFAASLHLASAGVVYGMIALAVGAWTGNAALTSGGAAGFLILSFFGAGILPIIDSIAWLARIFPWFYMVDGTPINKGIVWPSLLVLGVIALAMVGIAVAGVNRRDLRVGIASSSLRDRLSSNRILTSVLERMEASGQTVRTIAAKAFNESRPMIITASVIVLYMGVLMGPMYNLIDDVLIDFGDSFPEGLLAIVGTKDLSSVSGWYSAEIFSIVGPAAALVLTISMAAKALGGEQDRGSMDVLLANPVSRSHVVLHNAAAIAGASVGFGLATFVGTWAGAALITSGGLELVNVAAVSVHIAGLAMFFGAFAMLVGAITGRTSIAVGAASGLGIASYVLNAFSAVSENYAWLGSLSPFGWYSGSDPLNNGFSGSGLVTLAVGSALLIGLAVFAFLRADIKN